MKSGPGVRLPSWLGLQNTLTASQQRAKISPNECPVYDAKQSDGEVPVMLELWGMWSTLLLSMLSDPLWSGSSNWKGPIFG